jgi:hypothetical protein
VNNSLLIKIAVLAAFLPLGAQAAEINVMKRAVPASQNKPQTGTPLSLRGMSAAQFQALPPGATFLLGNKQVTKGDVLKIAETARTGAEGAAKGLSQKMSAELQQLNSKFQIQQKAALSAANTALGNKYANASKRPDKVNLQLSAGGPKIISVECAHQGSMTAGGWVAIKGENFGFDAGKVSVVLQPGGSSELVVKSWYPGAIVAEVPYSISAPDQTAMLFVTVGSQSVSAQVPFLARRIAGFQPIIQPVTGCATQPFNNFCASDDHLSFHANLPGDETILTGTDTYQLKPLRPGWKFRNPYNPSEPWLVQTAFGKVFCNRSGSSGTTFACNWTMTKAPLDGYPCAFVKYSFFVWVEGPEGTEP